MKIPLTPPALTAGDAAKTAAASPERALLDSLALRNGQATLARVLDQLPADARSRAVARLMLDVGGQTLTVDSDIELQPGTLLRLQRTGNELRLLESLGNASGNALNQALAQKLPVQFDIQGGLKLIAALSRTLADTGTTTRPATPAPAPGQATASATTAGGEAARIRAALTQVLQIMPRQAELQGGSQPPAEPVSAVRVREWIQNSGLFTEARLAATGDSSPGNSSPSNSNQSPVDLKSQLLRLAVQLLKTDVATAATDLGRLRPAVSPDLVQQALHFPLTPVSTRQAAAPSEALNAGALLRIIAGMINRMTVNQLHSQALSSAATADGSPAPQTWLLELPWLNPHQEPKVVQVRIERHEGGEHEEEADKAGKGHLAQWRLNLALDLDEMGPLYFELALTQKSLATKIWAEQEATWRLVDSHAGRLRDNLGTLGLQIKSLECHHGQPPQTRTRLDHRLVDEKA